MAKRIRVVGGKVVSGFRKAKEGIRSLKPSVRRERKKLKRERGYLELATVLLRKRKRSQYKLSLNAQRILNARKEWLQKNPEALAENKRLRKEVLIIAAKRLLSANPLEFSLAHKELDAINSALSRIQNNQGVISQTAARMIMDCINKEQFVIFGVKNVYGERAYFKKVDSTINLLSFLTGTPREFIEHILGQA